MSKCELTVSDVDDLKHRLDLAMRKHGRWIYGQPARALSERWDDDRKAVVLSYQVPDDEIVAMCNSFSTTADDLWGVTFDCSTDQGRQLIDRVIVEIANESAGTEAGREAVGGPEPNFTKQVYGTIVYRICQKGIYTYTNLCKRQDILISDKTYRKYRDLGWIPLSDESLPDWAMKQLREFR